MKSAAVPFEKYDTMGAYHWAECQLASRRYNPPLAARYHAVARRVRGCARVLDIGCGDGYLMHLVRPFCDVVIGIDPAPRGIAYAAEYLGSEVECRVALANGYALPFPDDAFDAVLFTDVIEHLERPEICLDEIRRVLQPHGMLLVTTPRQRPEQPLGWGHVHEFTAEELAHCLMPFFTQVQLVYLWPLIWFRLYGTRLGWRLIRLFARYVANPFVREGGEPAKFAQMLAVCSQPRQTSL